jgi:hypothetical protein
MRKTSSLIIFVTLLTITLHAQTNLQKTAIARKTVTQYTLPPGYASLANVSNRIASLQSQRIAAYERQNKLSVRFHLQVEAGQAGDNSAAAREYNRTSRETEKQVSEINRQIAALRLQEVDIRETYKIPATTKTKAAK